MDREQRQALLLSDRMVKTEDLIQGQMYRIHHLSPSYDDDDIATTLVVQLETCAAAYIFTSWPACPFGPADVFCINTGVLRWMMMCRTISEPRIIHIYLISITQVHLL
jgi:hypothetical protein